MSERAPNILLITTDSQRCDSLACMGHPYAHSPNVDRLAAEGVTFMEAYTACPACIPARSSLMTGMHTHVHGAVENGIIPRDHLATFPDLLRNAGFTTIHAGISHVGPLHPDYDDECVIVGGKGLDASGPYAEFLADHGIDRRSRDGPLPAALHMEAFLVDRTISAIKKARSQSDRPFFAHCSLVSPHEPIDPPAGWDALYQDRALPEVNYRHGELEQQPAMLHDLLGLRQLSDRFRTSSGELDASSVDYLRRRYYSLAAFCDDQVGRLIRFLDASGIRENTLIIFTSDHGVQLLDHGFNSKHCYYDASWRVPFIMSMPGTLPSGATRGIASWIDIAPSILGAAGLSCGGMQGFDLFTPLKNGALLSRVCAAATIYNSSAVVSGRWKFEMYFGESETRLYDRRGDACEQANLADAPQWAHVRRGLQDALLLWRAETMDIQWMQSHTEMSNGPVIQNVIRHTTQLTGATVEKRLNDRIAALEANVAHQAHGAGLKPLGGNCVAEL